MIASTDVLPQEIKAGAELSTLNKYVRKVRRLFDNRDTDNAQFNLNRSISSHVFYMHKSGTSTGTHGGSVIEKSVNERFWAIIYLPLINIGKMISNRGT